MDPSDGDNPLPDGGGPPSWMAPNLIYSPAMETSEGKQPIITLMPVRLHRGLKAAAEAEGTSMNGIVRRLVEGYLVRHPHPHVQELVAQSEGRP